MDAMDPFVNRPDYNSTPAERPLFVTPGETGDIADARAPTRMQWRLDGQNAEPTVAIIASHQNLIALPGQEGNILQEIVARSVNPATIRGAAAAMTLWNLINEPNSSQATEQWTVDQGRTISLRVLDGDENGDGWEPDMETNVNPPADLSSPVAEIGYLIRTPPEKKAKAGRSPPKKCEDCTVLRPVTVRLDMNDFKLPTVRPACAKGHYVSVSDVRFKQGRSGEDFYAQLICQSDRNEKEYARRFNKALLVHVIRAIVPTALSPRPRS